MNTRMMIEMAGYFGSALVLVSFLMVSVVKLRVINALGSLIFAIYALIIQSYPTALMNFCLVGINIFYLVRFQNTGKHYHLISGTAEDAFFRYVLGFYKEDIKHCFPTLQLEKHQVDVAYIVCSETTPAGLFLGSRRADGALEIALDYSIPAYRDYSVEEYLYAKLQKEGFTKLIYTENPDKHEPYLKKMGFVQEDGVFVKRLSPRE